MINRKSNEPVRLDLNNPVFQRQLFNLPKNDQRNILNTLRKLSKMTWSQVYTDHGLKWDLNPASAEFAGDARRQGRRCIRILQVLANAADSAKSALPEGKLFSKNPPTFAAFKLMNVKNLSCFNNLFVIQLENFFLKTVYAGFRYNTIR